MLDATRIRDQLRRWRPRGAGDQGRTASLGHDHDSGHRGYVAQLAPGERLWLRTKPFSAPPSMELGSCLHTFAHAVERLNLGLRAQVLDVGCGPGWLSEFLARCGYWVTGVDISEDMVEIARGRIAAIPRPVGEGVEPLAEFFAMPVREMPWESRFDAAILYDALHHFDDELATLEVIRRTLVPGGRIYIREGVRPAPGSSGERHLIAEMERYRTLEAPFDPRYLASILKEAGFVAVKRFVEVDQLFDLSSAGTALRPLARYAAVRARLAAPASNTLVATTPLAAANGGAKGFVAELGAAGPWRATRDGRQLVLQLTVENAGSSFWPTAASYPFPTGAVTIAPYLAGERGERVELPRTPLPHSLRPGESARLVVRVPRELAAGHAEIRVDLVREGVHWFSEHGSRPLSAPVAAE